MEKKEVHITLRLPADWSEWLANEAKKSHRSKRSFLMCLIEKAINDRKEANNG